MSKEKCPECEDTGIVEEDGVGALGYVVKKACPRGCSIPEDCPHCRRPEDAVNHVPGHIFVGWGHGWQPCPHCGGTTKNRKPVCSTCNDTHQMTIHGEGEVDRVVMCTQCPVPCQRCRAGGNGPYCEKTPCDCACHAKHRTSDGCSEKSMKTASSECNRYEGLSERIAKFTRQDDDDHSTLFCRCGDSFRWSGADDRLFPWLEKHEPHAVPRAETPTYETCEHGYYTLEDLLQATKIAQEHEREECAKIADQYEKRAEKENGHDPVAWLTWCAAAIRTRRGEPATRRPTATAPVPVVGDSVQIANGGGRGVIVAGPFFRVQSDQGGKPSYEESSSLRHVHAPAAEPRRESALPAGALTQEQLIAACNNIGYDLTCGACAMRFFTGYTLPTARHDLIPPEHEAHCKTDISFLAADPIERVT